MNKELNIIVSKGLSKTFCVSRVARKIHLLSLNTIDGFTKQYNNICVKRNVFCKNMYFQLESSNSTIFNFGKKK